MALSAYARFWFFFYSNEHLIRFPQKISHEIAAKTPEQIRSWVHFLQKCCLSFGVLQSCTPYWVYKNATNATASWMFSWKISINFQGICFAGHIWGLLLVILILASRVIGQLKTRASRTVFISRWRNQIPWRLNRASCRSNRTPPLVKNATRGVFTTAWKWRKTANIWRKKWKEMTTFILCKICIYINFIFLKVVDKV